MEAILHSIQIVLILKINVPHEDKHTEGEKI